MSDELRADANFDQALEAAKTFIAKDRETFETMFKMWNDCSKSHATAANFVRGMRLTENPTANQAAYLVCRFASLGAAFTLGRMAGRDI